MYMLCANVIQRECTTFCIIVGIKSTNGPTDFREHVTGELVFIIGSDTCNIYSERGNEKSNIMILQTGTAHYKMIE